MDLARPLAVITPTVDGDVLAALALADDWFTTGRLHRTVGRHSEDGIRRALRRLVEQGIVEDRAAGNANLYRLNRDHLAAAAVTELADLRGRLIRRLIEHLSGWSPPPKFAALFGSAARGTMTTSSDIDFFLVQATDSDPDDSWPVLVAQFEGAVSSWTGNDARVLKMTEAHVRANAGQETVLGDVLADGVPLLGDVEWLSALVRRARSDV